MIQGQRDLYIALRDLFIRHDRLSGDQVDRLKKRVDSNSMKLEGVKQAQKEGWEAEADKFTVLIEKDQAAIAAALNRRIFVRAWCVYLICTANPMVDFLYPTACGTSCAWCCTIARMH